MVMSKIVISQKGRKVIRSVIWIRICLLRRRLSEQKVKMSSRTLKMGRIRIERVRAKAPSLKVIRVLGISSGRICGNS